jgi:ABC-2 type transport system permease protein
VRRLIRASAFLSKEIAEIIRQPRLILTLIVGPFLILLLFGLGYTREYAPVRTLYLASPTSPFVDELQNYVKELGTALTYVGTEADPAIAQQRLKSGEVDLVIAAPADPNQVIKSKQQIPFVFYFDQVDPFMVDHMKYIAQILVSVINRKVLEQYVTQQGGNATQGVPAAVAVQPYEVQADNLAESSPTPAQFFGPAVIILLLQHLAVTFGALSIVREKSLGSMDLFRVSPLTSGETLFGKYLSYYLFGAVIAFVLVVLLVFGFSVPMVGSWVMLGFAMALVLFASLGWGFVISSLARTDSQAVQYTMLILLAGFFFSGFVLSLDTLTQSVRVVSRILPATYGIAFMHDVMLRGKGLNHLDLLGVLALGVVLLILSWILVRRGLRRA